MAKSRGRKFAEITSPTSGVFDLTSVPTITNAKLQNSAMTLAGSSVSLGGTGVADTDALSEGSSNLYFTNARVQTFLGGGTLAGNIVVPDNRSIYLGSDSDFRMVHNTTNTQLINATGALQLTSNGGFDVTGAATFSSTIAATGAITANAGVVVDNITIDGTEIDLSSGDMTLDVAGDIILDADGGDILFKDGGTHWASLYTNGTNTYLQNMISDGDIYLTVNDGGSSVNALIIDGSEAGKATFNAGGVFNGNLSIGTTNTSQFVTILKDHTGYTDIGVSNNTSNSDLYLGVGGSGAGNTDLRNAAYVLSGGASSSLVLGANTDEKMRILASGNIGIATASPSTVLDVNGVLGVGNARVHETRVAQTLAVTTAANRGGMSINSWYNSVTGPLLDFNVSRNNTAGSHTVVQTDDALGTLIFRGDDGDEFIDSGAIEVNVDAAPGNGDMPGRMVFYTSPDGTTGLQERMRIDNQGRVGINVDPDTALLEIARTNNDTYTPTGFLENQQIRIKHPNATNNYGGIGFSNSVGNYEWFAGTVQTGSTTADFIIQGADSTSTYSEVFRINSQGTVTVPGNLTAQNVINIGSDASIQTTSARQWATIKNTGTSSSDYSELKISNNNDDYLIMGSIGSNYTHIDWASSSYIYANRELRIKSQQGIRFFTGGFNMNSHDRMYLNSNGQLTVTGNASGGAYITKSVDGTGDQEILRIGRIGGATSNGERRASISFYDSANATYTAKISGYRENPAGNYSGGLKFYVNPHSVNANATFAELDNTPAMYLRADRSMEMVAGHVIMPNGYGIHFGATASPSNSASITSEVLDDYEEGTWTPTLPNGGSVTNYKSTYTKIGRFVYLYCYIYISPSNNGSQLRIGGMPYIAFNTSNYHTNGTIGYSSNINTASYRPLVYYNQSYMYFHRTNGSGVTLSNNGIYVSGGPLLMNISYETNT